MSTPLGKLEIVDPRKLWSSESAHFTPWLASPENIARLGEALGIELEVEAVEVAVGPYSADILARDSATGSYVVIENQLGKTDHDHLGKALTYAATLGATAVVWIATNFTTEHRKALDWLNDSTAEGFWFYGVSLELWQIDGSNPAVRFNVLTRPPEAALPRARRAAQGELSDARRLQLEWWTAFSEALVARKVLSSAQSPRPQYWFNVALGRSGFGISCTANTYDNKIGVRVIIRGTENADAALAQLLDARAEIERAVGTPLLWNPNPETRDKIIAVYRDADLTKRELWPEYLDWMVGLVSRVRNAFGPRVKALDLDSESEDE